MPYFVLLSRIKAQQKVHGVRFNEHQCIQEEGRHHYFGVETTQTRYMTTETVTNLQQKESLGSVTPTAAHLSGAHLFERMDLQVGGEQAEPGEALWLGSAGTFMCSWT